ncbi:TPA: biotin-independent malonate decarboxylase subunit gamma [Klebsiella pneumoniae]
MENLLGQGRAAIDLLVDKNSFEENALADLKLPYEDYGPGAVVGSARINGEICTVIANDAMTFNPRFPVVYAGVIGLEEGYKMALAVYRTLAMDKDKPVGEKRPLVLIVDTPGNGPGKLEEIIGMNKATGAYQLALAEARHAGHPIIAMVIGRAISGAFLCHGLQADHILSLTSEFGTMIHVMPLSSIARITR